MEKISECEEMVLVVVYRSRTIPRVKDILVDVNWLYGREWKAQTVSTFLSRLIRKGYLRTEKGRDIYYYPVIALEEYRKSKLKELKEGLFENDGELLGRYLREL